MPIEIPTKTTAPVFFPKSNYKIVRYLDLPKFLSLIQTQKIFFSKLDNFEDPFEGTLPETSYKILENWYRTILYPHLELKTNKKFDIETEIKKDIIRDRKAYDEFKKMVCISCWNKFENESYALWKIYAGLNQGIAIKTDVNRVIKAFKNTKEKIQISEIEYIDFNKDIIDISNMNYPIIHKNKPYNYENEVRLIYQIKIESNLENDSQKNSGIKGENLSVDINSLIEEIIVSPFSPNWFFDVVKNVVEKYEINKKVVHSEFR